MFITNADLYLVVDRSLMLFNHLFAKRLTTTTYTLNLHKTTNWPSRHRKNNINLVYKTDIALCVTTY